MSAPKRSGAVVSQAFSLASPVGADPRLIRLADPLLAAAMDLLKKSRDREDAGLDALIKHGPVVVLELATEVYLVTFTEKLAGEYATTKVPGRESAEYKRIMLGQTAASFLPARRDARTTALAGLKARIADRRTAAPVKAFAADLVKAIDAELAAAGEEKTSLAAFAEAGKVEDAALERTEEEIRACTNKVKAELKGSPAEARRILGQADPGQRRSKAEEAKRLAAEAAKLAAIAQNAVEAAQKADADAKEAAAEAEAEAKAKADAEAKKKAKKGGKAA